MILINLRGDIMSKKVANTMLISIAMVWALCFFFMGFNVFAIFFGVLGTVMVIEAVDEWIKTKGEMYLANKYDENKKKQ